MSLYTIGDLHLSLGTNKPMDVFGGRWENYVQKLSEGFSQLNDDDLTVLCGDITWGMTMEEALPDFKFIDALPGKKIILKGNHDYWWTTATKARSFLTCCTTRALLTEEFPYAERAAGSMRKARALSMIRK